MTDVLTPADDYGVLTEPTTLRIERMLPGPIERVWDYLTDSDLRAKWLAAGRMEMRVGAPVELTWRNDELTDPPGERPADFGPEHSMTVEIVELEPPHRLAISWGSTGGVVFDLTREGDQVRLVLTHKRVMDPAVRLNISAGWPGHLDILKARMEGREPATFWPRWLELKAAYAERLQV
jgi:uncharacterized protein YndB with AHSA1/START domain